MSFEEFKSKGLPYLDSFFMDLNVDVKKDSLNIGDDNRSVSDSEISSLRFLNNWWNRLPKRLKTIFLAMNLTPRILTSKGLRLARDKSSVLGNDDIFVWMEAELKNDWDWVKSRLRVQSREW